MSTADNIARYSWFKFFQNLNFWQAVWFLYFQTALGPAEAILLYVVYDVSATALEVPSGYMSDRVGRRPTLVLSALCAVLGALCLFAGSSFALFALGQALLGAGMAFSSGTDSALLYESLDREGRGGETEAQELRAWRFGFGALALSAVLGGALSYVSPALPFAATALAGIAMLTVALRFAETGGAGGVSESLRFAALGHAFRVPVLRWVFALAVLMYGYSHLPFVFGQPFILQALEGWGLSAEAPLVSGVISALMMMLSVLASLYALRLRAWAGLPAILLFAFALQIFLVSVLAASASALVIGLLLLRMVPDSLSQPFIIARVQPLLKGEARATYLSLQSLIGRLFFAATLWLASGQADGAGEMRHGEISTILWAYAGGGLICLVALALTARRAGVEPQPT